MLTAVVRRHSQRAATAAYERLKAPRAPQMAGLLGALFSIGGFGCSVDDRVLQAASGEAGVPEARGHDASRSADATTNDAGKTPAEAGFDGGGGAVLDAGGCKLCGYNIVDNADFDSGISGWSAESTGTIEWSKLDASKLTWSGSLAVENLRFDSVDGMTAIAARQCAPATAGRVYEIQTMMTIGVLDGSGDGGLSVRFYAGPDCSPPALPGGFTTTSAARVGAWGTARGQATAPQGTGSAAIRLVAIKPLRERNVKVTFDEIRIMEK
jgi:hypothetical protein